MAKLYVLMGKSASGKDTVYHRLLADGEHAEGLVFHGFSYRLEKVAVVASGQPPVAGDHHAADLFDLPPLKKGGGEITIGCLEKPPGITLLTVYVKTLIKHVTK